VRAAAEVRGGFTEAEKDALLFDPEADDDDERWMALQMRGAQDGTDAVLSCPGCFTVVTTQCQAHEVFPNQFRAVLVRDVVVGPRAVDAVQPGSKRGRGDSSAGAKRRKESRDCAAHGGGGVGEGPARHGVEPAESPEVLLPVACANCGAELGVVDEDEVYHFTQTLPT